MRLLSYRLLHGVNAFADYSVVSATIETSAIEAGQLAAIWNGIQELLPESNTRLPSWVTNAPELWSAVAALLTSATGGPSLPTLPQPGELEAQWIVGCGFGDARGAAKLPRLVTKLLNDALGSGAAAPANTGRAALEEFFAYAHSQALGAIGENLARAAETRGIPWFRVRYGQSLAALQLGWGNAQRRLNGTRSPFTPYLGCKLSHEKSVTSRLLLEVGLPVPEQRRVQSAAEAVQAASDIGYPVVVKPTAGNRGRGVATDLRTAAQVKSAFSSIAKANKPVLVERHVPGDDHRLLVVGGELCSVVRRIPAFVLGDGQRSVMALVDEFNSDPERQGRSKMLHPVAPGDDMDRVLIRQGLTRLAVPAKGQAVTVGSTANLHQGGIPVDVTKVCHPENRILALRAAAQLNLDIAGVDLLITDISRSWREVGGAICEVNDYPGVRVHLIAEGAKPEQILAPIVNHLYPPGDDGRIPLLTALAGPSAKKLHEAWSHHMAGADVRHAARVGGQLWLADGHPAPTTGSGVGDLHRALNDPWSEAVASIVAAEETLSEGLGFDRSDVAVLLDVAESPSTALAAAKVHVRATAGPILLEAEASYASPLLAELKPARVTLVAKQTDQLLLSEHLARGGSAYLAREGTLVRLEDGKTIGDISGEQPSAVACGRIAASWVLDRHRQLQEKRSAWRPRLW